MSIVRLHFADSWEFSNSRTACRNQSITSIMVPRQPLIPSDRRPTRPPDSVPTIPKCGSTNSPRTVKAPIPARPRRLGRYRETLIQLLSHRAEAVAAVHWPVAARQERHLRVNATLGAYRWMHLPRATAIPTAPSSLLVSAGAPASLAAAGLIGEPLRSKKTPVRRL